MTTGQDLVDDVRAIFGDTFSVQVLDPDFIRWINDGLLEVARTVEYGATTSAPIPAVVGQMTYPLAPDFLKPSEVMFGGMLLIQSTKQKVDTWNRLRYNTPVSTGNPYWFYIEGQNISFYPIPMDGTVSFTYSYVPRPPTVTDLTTPLTYPPEILNDVKQFLLARCYEVDDNPNEADTREKKFRDQMFFSRDESKFPSDNSYPSIRELPDW